MVTFHCVRVGQIRVVRVLVLLKAGKEVRQTVRIPDRVQSLDLHNAALAPLYTLTGLHLQLGHTVQLGGVTNLRLNNDFSLPFPEILSTSSP